MITNDKLEDNLELTIRSGVSDTSLGLELGGPGEDPISSFPRDQIKMESEGK